jgi:hypothetical protein
MINTNRHLTDEHIHTALVDELDLTPDARHHLSGCPDCRGKIDRLAGELTQLRRLAQQMVPTPARKAVALVCPPSQPFMPFMMRFPALAAGLALLLLLTGLWLWPALREPPPSVTTSQMTAEFYFLDDILEDAALPEPYQGIIVATNATFSDDFLEYVSGDLKY